MMKTDFDHQLIKELAPFALILAVVLFLIPALLLTRLPQMLELRQINQQNRAYLARLVAKAAALENFSPPDLQKMMALSLSALPAQKQIGAGIAAVSQSAAEVGVTVVSFSLQPGFLATQSAQGVESFVMKYTLAGGWENLGNFWTRINNTLPLFAVEKFKLTGSGDQFQAEAELKTFALNLPEKLGPPDEAVPLLTKEEEKTVAALEKFTAYSFPIQEATPAGKSNPFAF